MQGHVHQKCLDNDILERGNHQSDLKVKESGRVQDNVAPIKVEDGDLIKLGNQRSLHNCPQCPLKFTFETNMQRHTKLVHLKCPHCDHSASQAVHLDVHIETIHLKIRDLKCPHCDYAALQAVNLRNHVKSVHLKIRDHKCTSCDFATHRPWNLKVHNRAVHQRVEDGNVIINDHTGIQDRDEKKQPLQPLQETTQQKKRPIIISLQPKYQTGNHKPNVDTLIRDNKNTFDPREYLSLISRPARIKLKTCQLRLYKTSISDHLKQHVNTVHKNKQNFKCHQCPKTYLHKHNLKLHMGLVHIKVRGEKCPRCPKAFSRVHHLQDHIKAVHDKIRDKMCTHCTRAFSLTSNLRTHIKREHGCEDKSFKSK
jgi:KRAB domain-containing zinc finger protein